jgi:putative membrane-bound dehydrogenase-like protein
MKFPEKAPAFHPLGLISMAHSAAIYGIDRRRASAQHRRVKSPLRWLLALPVLASAEFPKVFDTEKTPGGPMPAEEAARTVELPPGFKCQVFAAEPHVQQPIAMAWDARGRLWIAECYTYAENPDRWNTTLRDRILIFEDADKDGRFDKRTVFWDEGVRLTSIEIGYGGVYALCAPNLLFLPDKNGDDVPDGPPQVLLDGFNFKTIGHNVVNGLRWGPDGWLYGRHGITDTSAIGAPGTPAEQRTRMNCGIFRWHPVKRTFEIVCQGGTNSWGMDWNGDGELFWINTVIGHLFHGIPGAYYDRMFGAHLNPHVYELIPQTADHYHWDHDAETWDTIRKGSVSAKTDTLGGGHAHVGCVIYNGGLWPAEYQDKLFTCNLHGNRINMDILERQGCGYVARHGTDFMKSKDKWFRGIDLSTGPDGNVYVIDWSDAGECHDNDGVHRTSGRIY